MIEFLQQHSPAFYIRTIGDVLLLLTLPSILICVRLAGSAAVSLETQGIILLTFILRYMDLAQNWLFHKWHLVFFKCAYVTLSFVNVASISALQFHREGRLSWPTLMIPIVSFSAILALPLHYKAGNRWSDNVLEFMWAWSEYLGGLALLPQILLSWSKRFRDEEPKRMHRTILIYLIMLAIHQTIYIINWSLRFFLEKSVDPISVNAGCFRLLSIIIFLFKYSKKDKEGQVRLI